MADIFFNNLRLSTTSYNIYFITGRISYHIPSTFTFEKKQLGPKIFILTKSLLEIFLNKN